MSELLGTLPQVGRIEWIGVRPGRREPMAALETTAARPGEGLEGDRFSGRPASRRQVTLIQAEHLDAVASMLGRASLPPELVRRNLVVRGLNLLALKDRRFTVGDVLMEYTGACHPCSRMEEALGAGGYNAMRGHGGITARVLEPGTVRIGDTVRVV